MPRESVDKTRKPRKKRCKVCRKSFRPFMSTTVVCSPGCAIEYSRERAVKRELRQHRRERRQHRADKESIKPRAQVQAEAQKAFNAFIRLRDEHQPCISCGAVDPPQRFGGVWDCGHYLTVAAHPELRFNELNAHRQCKSCNAGFGRFTRKSDTVQQNYRHRLVTRIGLAKVERLEGPHAANKYTADDLREIKAEYQQKRLELKRSRY